MNNKQLYLIDGYALIYRAYFALLKNPLSNSKGVPSGAFFGFASYIIRLLETYSCPYIAVVMDSAKPTFRHLLYDKYKANREAMPDELRAQIPIIRQFIDACNIPTLIQEGLEADDLIASATVKAVEAGFDVYLVTRDKDLMQLINPNVTMLAPAGAGVLEQFSTPQVLEKMGVVPEKIVDYLSLIGDASDNIPGVAGVGPKTAIKLLEQVGTVEKLLENTSVIANQKLRQKIDDNREMLLLSKQLVTLKCDAPLVFSLEELIRKPINSSSCSTLIREMECLSLLRSSLFSDSSVTKHEPRISIAATNDDLVTYASRIREQGVCAFYTFGDERSTIDIYAYGCACALSESEAIYIPLHGTEPAFINQARVMIHDLLENPSLKIIGHNVKREMHAFAPFNVKLHGDLFDCMIAAYLADPGKRDYTLPHLAEQWLSEQLAPVESLTGSGKQQRTFDDVSAVEASLVCGAVACTLFALEKKLRPLLHERKLWTLFTTIELPLVHVLAVMERHGIRVDTAHLKELSNDYTARLSCIAQELYTAAGEEFNINSPKQLGDILFDKLHLPAPKKTKTGAHATGIEILEHLSADYPIVQKIIDHRELQKLLSTYIDTLPLQINPATNRIHTSFNQTIAATGRLSSTDPNLQNIPIRSEDGKRIRNAFIPEEGNLLISADYSQIELRILAHLSNDPLLIQAFMEDKDIHTQTASAIYGIFPEMITPEMRRAAKTINFGLMYGMGPINLSRQLGISFAEAREFIETYFCQFPTIKKFMESTIEAARHLGYVETLLGRRRYLPDINATNRVLREATERTAINTPVQGTAADIIKIAMIHIDAMLSSAYPEAKMLLQVHDELVFEIPEADAVSFKDWIVGIMSNAYTLAVPLKVEAGTGHHWNEAH